MSLSASFRAGKALFCTMLCFKLCVRIFVALHGVPRRGSKLMVSRLCVERYLPLSLASPPLPATLSPLAKSAAKGASCPKRATGQQGLAAKGGWTGSCWPAFIVAAAVAFGVFKLLWLLVHVAGKGESAMSLFLRSPSLCVRTNTAQSRETTRLCCAGGLAFVLLWSTPQPESC